MKVLLIGANGQLGWELVRTCPETIELTAPAYPQFDLCRPQSMASCISELLPDWIVNAAAYTAVDAAEHQASKADQLNHQGVADLSALADKYQARLVHISTDFVFNGENFKPYTPGDLPCPESVYGRSKLNGEIAAGQIMGDRSVIIRTAWLYSVHGRNFVKTMLDLMQEKPLLKVIDEQIGTPTWAFGLANAIWTCIEKKINGLFHWTDAGVASWYDFAVAIQEEALLAGLLSREIPILPVPVEAYPTPARRPLYGVLDKRSLWQATQITPVHWRKQLRQMVKELKE